MIEIVYKNGMKDIFEIYSESDDYIVWKDYAQNLIKINKYTGKTTLLYNGNWMHYDMSIESYKKL